MSIQLIKLSAITAMAIGLGSLCLADNSPPSGAVRIGSDFTKIAINSEMPWTIHYGVPGNWLSITGAGMAPVQCEPNTFGRDPAPNVPKSCFLSGAPAESIVSAVNGHLK